MASTAHDDRSIDGNRDDAFVGRVSLAAELRSLHRAAQRGSGRVVAVRGEAGVGKTRLVDRVLTGDNTLWARCRETGSPPLWPWTQIARAASRTGVAGLESIMMSGSGSVVEARTVTASGHDRFEQFDRLARALSEAAATKPLTIVFDDVQWADDDSVELLSFVAGTIARSQLLVVLTVRDGEPFAAPALDELLHTTDVVTIDVPGLARDELAELLERLLDHPPAIDVVDAVAAHSGGNPFFVTETAQLMRSSGRSTEAAAWMGVLPVGVRSVLVRRFARLPQESDAIVRAAAILGIEFDVTVLAALVEVDRAFVLDRLDPVLESGMVRGLGDGRYAFAHALVREAALSRVPVSGRRAYHHRAAMVLTAVLGSRAAAEIAEHHTQADDTDEARQWCIAAGRQAASGAMHADAARWLERALRSPTLTEHHDDLDVRIEFASAAARCGRTNEAAAAYADAVRIARDAGRTEAFATAVLGVGTVGGSFEIQVLDPAHQALLREALELMEPGDSALRSWLTARLSVASSLETDSSTRQCRADEAVAIAKRIGDAAALAHALAAYCDSRSGPAYHDDRLAAAMEMLAAAIRASDPELELLSHRYVIVALMEEGNVTLAIHHITAFATLADRLRQPQFRWYARLMEGMIAHLHGDLDAAWALAAAASAEGHASGSANAHMLVEGALKVVVLRDRGDLDGSQALYRQVLFSHHEASRGFDSTPMTSIDFEPEPTTVRRLLDAVPEVGLVSDNDAIYLLVTALTACSAAYVGDEIMARRYIAHLGPYAHRFVLDGFAAVCYGPVALFIGKAEALLGNNTAARQHFALALQLVAPMSAPALVADIQTRLTQLDSPTTAATNPNVTAMFVRDGEVWDLSFGGQRARFTDAKGLRDLAALIARPCREMHVLELNGGGMHDGGGTLGPMLDAAARHAYEDRVRELTDDIDEAERLNDIARAARLDDERDAILRQLTAALGLSGRDRRAGNDPAERARKAVSMRIHGAIDKIEHEMPHLGRHLRHAIHTGTFCRYEPEHPVEWST